MAHSVEVSCSALYLTSRNKISLIYHLTPHVHLYLCGRIHDVAIFRLPLDLNGFDKVSSSPTNSLVLEFFDLLLDIRSYNC